MTHQGLIDQLARQLGFLRRSCESYDAGFEDEAIRIAVVIRTLIHDTQNSTSLLAYFNKPHLHLLSTCPEISASHLMFSGGLSCAHIKVENNDIVCAEYVPMLDAHKSEDRLVPWKGWWEQVIYVISEGRISRKQIVLAAANKDGGAHVDQNLTPEYEALQRGVGTLRSSLKGEEEEFAMKNVHLSDLRQMGHEILNSPDVISLAR